jgi:tetratricopeptide (TPR) repeat protein
LTTDRPRITLWEGEAGDNPSVTKFQSDLALSHNNIGILQGETGHPDQALESFNNALAIRERLARENPTVTEFQNLLAGSHLNIGNFQKVTGHPDQALESYGKALAISERLARDNPSVTEFQGALAKIHNSIGVSQSNTGHPAEALEAYGKALAILERLPRENPSVTEFQRALAASHNNIGILQKDTGHSDQALQSYGKALAIRERLAREHPGTPDYESALGGTLHNVARIDLDAKRFEQARDKLQQAIAWQKKALAANPRHPTYRQFLTNHLTNLIKAANAFGHADEAAAAEREVDELAATDPAKEVLDRRMDAVIRGEAPNDNRERLQLAYRAYEKKLNAASARLFAEALAADPMLADDRQAQHRYNAACAAALAANGTPTPPSRIKGEEEAVGERVQGAGRGASLSLSDTECAALRNQARTWLEAELKTWSKLLESATAPQRPAIVGTLKHWREDSDLAGVRDADALAKLPEDERKGWKSLWANVDGLLKKASTP